MEIRRPTKCYMLVAVFRATRGKRLLTDRLDDSSGSWRWHGSDDGRIEIAFRERSATDGNYAAAAAASGLVRIILGDDAEWQSCHGESCMAAGTFAEFDVSKRYFRLLSSIVGLPPVFIYRNPGLTIITSDLHLLTQVHGADLHFSPRAVSDFCQIGHPILGMTLFREVSMVAGGASLVLGHDDQIEESLIPVAQAHADVGDWKAYLELQVATLRRAMQSIDISKSFLSLTAGLDTRTILAMLLEEQKIIPTRTLTGRTLSLDARSARDLSDAYGFPHSAVVLGDAFFRDLPKAAEEASRLSGGLSSVEQAHEIYFYTSIGAGYGARLCGNLGNQVGRRGVERVSMRNCDRTMLSDAIRSVGERDEHWYAGEKSIEGVPDFEFLVRKEIPASSVGNYCIGNSFAVQQSPYASRELIQNALAMPVDLRGNSELSVWELRLRDLKHRFLGQTADRSFQVQIIRDVGGYVASYPINWGWRAQGGVSLSGVLRGAVAFVDAIAVSRGALPGVLSDTLETMRISGRHEYVRSDLWLRSHLRAFVYDELFSKYANQSGLFEGRALAAILEDFFVRKRARVKDVLAALDLALASRVFGASI